MKKAAKKWVSMFLVAVLAVLSAMTSVSAKEPDGSSVKYDYAELCEEYMEYIATNFPDRGDIQEGVDPGEDNRHEECRAYLISELKKAGYTEDEIEEDAFQTVKTRKGVTKIYNGVNLIVTIEGADPTKQIVVGAHYDGDGCGDNASGVALLLGNAVGMKKDGWQPQYTVKLVFFDQEEIGLYGAAHYAEEMTEEEAASTLFMLNVDSIAFGDYCNLYGGVTQEDGTVEGAEAYEKAMDVAESIGLKVYRTEDLDGYYEKNGEGPAIEANAIYSNPWTKENPAPFDGEIYSPATGFWSDHVDFVEKGIPYIYFEATNWYAEGDGGWDAYTGYFETVDETACQEGNSYDGMFMNTKYDTLANLQKLFPGRSLAHFHVYSPLLSALMEPVVEEEEESSSSSSEEESSLVSQPESSGSESGDVSESGADKTPSAGDTGSTVVLWGVMMAAAGILTICAYKKQKASKS